MRIVELKAQTAKIIYKPAFEELKIGDFVSLKENDLTIIGQIFKIMSSSAADDFNQADLFFTLTNKYNKTTKWQGEYVSAEAVIEKTPAQLLQNYWNIENDTKDFSLGNFLQYPTNTFKINFNYFKTPVFIGFEKPEDNLKLLQILAHQFDYNHEKLLVFDFKGNTKLNNAKNIIAGEQYKLPLNASSLNNLTTKILQGVSIESKAIIENILGELEEYAEKSGFIPISNLINVIDSTYKQTKLSQLLLLKNKLNFYKKTNLFADKKDEITTIFDTFKTNNVITLDISNIPLEWHKEFLNNILITENQNFSFHITIDELNSNNKIINQLLFKTANKNIKPLIAANYRYLAFDNIFDFAQNNILFKTHSSFKKRQYLGEILQTLPEQCFVLKGKLTKDLMPCISLYREEETNKNIEPQLAEININPTKEEIQNAETINSDINILNNILTPQQEPISQTIIEPDVLQQPNINEDITLVNEQDSLNQILAAPVQKNIDEQPSQNNTSTNITHTENENIIESNDNLLEDKIETEETEEIEEIEEIGEIETFDEINELEETTIQDNFENTVKINTDKDILNSNYDNPSDILEDLSVDDLDFLNEQTFEDNTTKNNSPEENDDDLLDLINESEEETENITEDLTDLDFEDNEINNTDDFQQGSPIPVYNANTYANENKEPRNINIKEGDLVKHNKYGIGTVKKITEHGDKILCHINFDNFGRRLLDPEISDLEKIE